jgi:hypothetical protein
MTWFFHCDPQGNQKWLDDPGWQIPASNNSEWHRLVWHAAIELLLRRGPIYGPNVSKFVLENEKRYQGDRLGKDVLGQFLSGQVNSVMIKLSNREFLIPESVDGEKARGYRLSETGWAKVERYMQVRHRVLNENEVLIDSHPALVFPWNITAAGWSDPGTKTEAPLPPVSAATPSVAAPAAYLPDSARNVILYGPPGTGKSHELDTRYEGLAGGKERIRVTFHPEYSYHDFVGTYRPAVGWKKVETEGAFTRSEPSATDPSGYSDHAPRTYYAFEPGPLSLALRQAAADERRQVVLLVEELNRGNCAAIFGDVFQLLDRGEDGWSQYPIQPTLDWAHWLRAQPHIADSGIFREPRPESESEEPIGLRLPPNLLLWATMNTSDQSLYPMDAAFRRRWSMEYFGVGVITTATAPSGSTVLRGRMPGAERNPGTTVPLSPQLRFTASGALPWFPLMRALNERILEAANRDDVQLGPFFVRHAVNREQFSAKILFHLWDSVCRGRVESLGRIFSEQALQTQPGGGAGPADPLDVPSFDGLLQRFIAGEEVFRLDLQQRFAVLHQEYLAGDATLA